MPKTLNQRIKELEKLVNDLKSKLDDISTNVEEKSPTPYSKVGGIRDRSQIRPVDIITGLGQSMGNGIPWNDSDLVLPPYGNKPADPTKGYNKHTHSQYAGGAFNVEFVEFVKYDIPNWDISDLNPHCQQYWITQPTIQKDQNTALENVEMIGLLDLIFNPDTVKWGVSAYEIDVKKCYFVERDEDGEIKLDDNGEEMKSPLWNEDVTKNNIVWDKNGKCWRLFATYAEEAE